MKGGDDPCLLAVHGTFTFDAVSLSIGVDVPMLSRVLLMLMAWRPRLARHNIEGVTRPRLGEGYPWEQAGRISSCAHERLVMEYSPRPFSQRSLRGPSQGNAGEVVMSSNTCLTDLAQTSQFILLSYAARLDATSVL
jgi:hypothetical protein